MMRLLWERRADLPSRPWDFRETAERLTPREARWLFIRQWAQYLWLKACYTYWQCRDGGSVWYHRQPRFWSYRAPGVAGTPPGEREGIWSFGKWQRKPLFPSGEVPTSPTWMLSSDGKVVCEPA